MLTVGDTTWGGGAVRGGMREDVDSLYDGTNLTALSDQAESDAVGLVPDLSLVPSTWRIRPSSTTALLSPLDRLFTLFCLSGPGLPASGSHSLGPFSELSEPSVQYIHALNKPFPGNLKNERDMNRISPQPSPIPNSSLHLSNT